MGHDLGVLKRCAALAGISIEEYGRLVSLGNKWCWRCREWHSMDTFTKDVSRSDGLSSACRKSQSEWRRRNYTPRPRQQQRGRRFVAPRDGDKEQARGRVNHLVRIGMIKDPDELPCTDCSHLGSDRRHEYDHHLGYAAENHESVESVCTTCHAARHKTHENRERNSQGQFA